MSRFLSRAIFCNSFVTSAAIVAGLAATQAYGEDIALANHSFELPTITAPGEGASPADVVLPFVMNWQETGAETTEQGFTGLLDTGVFLNIPFDLGGGFIVPAVPNADGSQLAYMRFNSTAGVTEPATTISQQTAENFQANSNYTFTLGVGPGFLQPPGSTDPVNNPYTAVLQIGYYDDGATVGGGFTPLADRIVDISELNLDGSLKDFSVTLTTDPTIDPLLAARQLVVLVEQSGGTTGSINIDNARLTRSDVPEPGSLTLLGLAGAVLIRRRRR